LYVIITDQNKNFTYFYRNITSLIIFSILFTVGIALSNVITPSPWIMVQSKENLKKKRKEYAQSDSGFRRGYFINV